MNMENLWNDMVDLNGHRKLALMRGLSDLTLENLIRFAGRDDYQSHLALRELERRAQRDGDLRPSMNEILKGV